MHPSTDFCKRSTYFYVRKEAVRSSQIEGTQSTLEQLLLFDNEQVPGVPAVDDIREVSSYVRAMQHGLTSIKSAKGLSLSLRLLKEIHGILLADGRGSHRMPGEFRISQNWIGGTKPGNATFVGPPSELVMPCLAEFEEFLHDKGGANSCPDKDRLGSRPVRNYPPLPRRQRALRPPAHNSPPMFGGCAERADAISQPVLQDPPPRVLRDAASCEGGG